MAEIQATTSGKKHRKISTPRIDLTPMVDLGFLLITFFMYTTTLAQPMVMELQMPPREPTPYSVTIPAESTIILLPTAQHKVAFYQGTSSATDSLRWCALSGNVNLRDLLQSEINRVKQLPNTFSAEAHKLHVLIKPDTAASFDDIVRILDEMAISEVPYYSVMRMQPEEATAIKKLILAGYGK